MPVSPHPDHGTGGADLASPPPEVPAPAGRGAGAQTEKVERLERELADLRIQERAALNEALKLREQLRRLSSARLVRLELRLKRLGGRVWNRWRRDGLFSRRRKEERRLIEASGLFDSDYYLSSYPDVAASEVDPISHYLRYGAAEGRNPSAAFSTLSYSVTYADVASSGLNPLVHYILIGKAERRSPLLPANPPRGGASTSDPSPSAAEIERPPFAIPDSTRSQPRIAVVLHLFYLDLWPEIGRHLGAIEAPFDLIVSVPVDYRAEAEAEIRSMFASAQVIGVENRGRDVGPFLELLGSGRLDRYDYLCKIHGKKSPHRVDGNEWRRSLLGDLLDSPQTVRHLLDWLDAHPEVGMVGPADRRVAVEESRWGSNETQVRMLAERIGLVESSLRVQFFAGSMFWCRRAALEPLKNLKLTLGNFEPEENQIDGTLAHALERLFLLVAVHAGFAVRETREVAAAALPASPLHAVLTTDGGHMVKTIAFYLPQFHPIAENDIWWGRGFTEWTNVARTRPMFEGHLQPRLPADLGFYDLRMPDVQDAQARLASAYGIHGFCYHYYWFGRRRLLETPIMQMLRSGRPDFPFCICWANENWTRRWDGLDHEILVEQNYGPGFAQAFIDEMIPFMRDPRYIRYEGRPVLLIYRAKTIPDLPGTIAIWREACRRAGLGEIHLCVVRFWDVSETSIEGFDAMVEFPPHRANVVPRNEQVADLNPGFRGNIYDYGSAIDQSLAENPADPEFVTRRGLVHRGLMMGWDNSARRGPGAGIFHGATPELFGFWLSGLLEQECRRASPESLIFINAWNEWAEGTVLEPDMRHGRGYLEATRDALDKAGRLHWGLGARQGD